MANRPFNVCQGDAGYQDVIECANTVAKVCGLQIFELNPVVVLYMLDSSLVVNVITIMQLLKMRPEEVLVESTGVIGQRIKKVESSTFCMPYKLC